MKAVFKIIIGVITLSLIYYLVSLLTMNGNIHVTHYYSYKSVDEAKEKNGLINENVSYELKNFKSQELERAIKDNIRIWISKSNYQEFYGFLIHFSKEDENLKRVTLESIKETDALPDDLFNKEIWYNDENQGSLIYSTIDAFRKNNQTLQFDVIKRSKGEPMKVGSIVFKVE